MNTENHPFFSKDQLCQDQNHLQHRTQTRLSIEPPCHKCFRCFHRLHAAIGSCRGSTPQGTTHVMEAPSATDHTDQFLRSMGHQASCPLQPQCLARQSLLEDIEDAIFVPVWLRFTWFHASERMETSFKDASKTLQLCQCGGGRMWLMWDTGTMSGICVCKQNPTVNWENFFSGEAVQRLTSPVGWERC